MPPRNYVYFLTLLFVRVKKLSFSDTRALRITLGGFYMIQRLQRLKNKRGYTMLELILVITILAIMAATILGGSKNRQNRIREATSTAKDFYTTIQTEFTRFQMFDGPLTMTLSHQYNASPNGVVGSGPINRRFGGVMWFPAVGGNYPILSSTSKMSTLHVNTDRMEWRNEAEPSAAGITIEVHVINNKIQSVDWDYTTSGLFAKSLDETKSELSAVLEMELDKRMEYRDGYYYARVVYNLANKDCSKTTAECRATPVKILWAAYCRNQITADESTYTFRKDYVSNAGEIVGVIGGTTPTGSFLGSTGSNIVNVNDFTVMYNL